MATTVHLLSLFLTLNAFTDSMILLGSVKRFELQRMLWAHLSEEQKIFLPDDHDEGLNSRDSTPGSSRTPTPPPRVEIIPATPAEGTKPRFMVTKVNETEKVGKKKDETIFTISRSVSRNVTVHSFKYYIGVKEDALAQKRCISIHKFR